MEPMRFRGNFMIFSNIKMLDSDFSVREHMYVQTKDEKIIYIGTTMPKKNSADEEVYDGTNRFLMNGFFNAHCHVPMTILRGYGEGLSLQDWLFTKIFPFEAKLTAEDIYWTSKLGAMELISSGCASISEMYSKIASIAKSLDECGLKANICNGITKFDRDESGFKDTYALRDVIETGIYKSENEKNTQGQTCSRIKLDYGIHSEYLSSSGICERVARECREGGYNVHVHLSETEMEHKESMECNKGKTPAQYFEASGILGGQVQFAHCVYVTEEDEELLKKSGSFLIHNPSSNLKLGSGIAPVKRWVEKGLNVCIGTDGASSNNNLDMLEEIHMAAMLCRGSSKDANAVSVKEIVKMATLNGALAQGRTDCGTIKVGNRADIIVFSLEAPHMQPDFDTLANIVFSAQNSDIVLNMIDGRVVYRDGNFAFIDRARVYKEVNARLKRILGELESQKGE